MVDGAEVRIRPIDSVAPPTGEAQRQRALLWSDLKVQPLKNALSTLSEKTHLDLHGLYTKGFEGRATTRMDDADLASYFDQKAENRQYYRIYADGKRKNTRGTLVTTERISDDLTAIAIFYVPDNTKQAEKTRAALTVKGKRQEYTFLSLSSLILHNTKNDQAVDLINPWRHSERALAHAFPDEPEDKRGKIRRVGLLPQDAKASTESLYQAVVSDRTILATDTPKPSSLEMVNAPGLERVPAINRWLATLLVAENAILKMEPLHEIEVATINFIAQALSGNIRADAVHALHRLAIKTNIPGFSPTGDAAKGIKEAAPRSAIKIMTTTIKNSLGTLIGLRNLGFDLCPGQTTWQLANAVVKYLRDLDRLYPRLQEFYGLSFTSSPFPPEAEQ